jgi:hypothetical protein
VVAVPNLTGVPHSVSMWLRGVAWAVKIKVEGWTEEEATFTAPPDTTPAQEVFTMIDDAIVKAIRPQMINSRRYVEVDFDVLYEV